MPNRVFEQANEGLIGSMTAFQQDSEIHDSCDEFIANSVPTMTKRFASLIARMRDVTEPRIEDLREFLDLQERLRAWFYSNRHLVDTLFLTERESPEYYAEDEVERNPYHADRFVEHVIDVQRAITFFCTQFPDYEEFDPRTLNVRQIVNPYEDAPELLTMERERFDALTPGQLIRTYQHNYSTDREDMAAGPMKHMIAEVDVRHSGERIGRRMLGNYIMNYRSGDEFRNEYATLLHMTVPEDLQRRGVGRAMMRYITSNLPHVIPHNVVENALVSRFPRLFCLVPERDSDAHKFLQACDFEGAATDTRELKISIAEGLQQIMPHVEQDDMYFFEHQAW